MNKRENIGKVKTSIKIKRAVWNVVCAIFFRPFITKVFRLWRIFLLKCFGADIDWGADVYASVKVWAPWNLTMKKGSCLGPGVICYNQAMVVLEENACVSQMATLCTAGHDVKEGNNAETGLLVAEIVLQRDAWVGMQAFVGMGVTVGEKSIVGARANVFRDVPSHSVVYAAVGNCASL